MDAATIVAQVVAFLFAISFHEAAHAWSADRLGDPTARDQGRITMNPVAHIDPFMTIVFPALLMMAGFPPFGAAKPVPVDTRNLEQPRRDHAWIAAAGPLSNVLLALVSVVLLRGMIGEIFPLTLIPAGLQEPVFALLMASLTINLLLAVFNMIPIPPLDGSWVLSNFLSGQAEAMYRSIQPYGFLILILLLWSGALGTVLRPVLEFGRLLVLL